LVAIGTPEKKLSEHPDRLWVVLALANEIVVRQPDAWGWTPTTVAAGATVVLALITAGLAWSTRALAKETGEDVRAEFRPILIGAATGEDGSAMLQVEPAMMGTGRASLDFFFTNVGPGPALNIKVTLAAFGIEGDTGGSTVERGTLGRGATNIHQHVRFEDQPFLTAWPEDAVFGYVFDLTYEDLNQNSYSTVVRYERKPGEALTGGAKAFKLRLVGTKLS
jgi:hypothetical protein